MPKSRYVASKRDIIIFFIISIFFTILSNLPVFDKNRTLKQNIDCLLPLLIFYVPQIIAIIINAIIKYADINNEKGLKITKILFNIFVCLYFIFMSWFLFICMAVSAFFGHLEI